MKNAFSWVQALLCLCFSFIYHSSIARPLSVGDVVPAYTIPHILQYPNASARLSDFKDQLLILDFMNTHCGSCMYHLRKMDTFQHQFAGRFQVISVCKEPVSKVQSYLQRPYMGRKFTTPFIAKDSILQSWFPYIYISHIVWIYKGKVLAITNPEQVTEANVSAVLRNESVRMPQKRDFGRYDPSYPFLTINPAMSLAESQDGPQFYSSVFNPLVGYSKESSEYRDTAAGLSCITYLNKGIIGLYESAFDLSDNLPETFIKLYVKDSTVFYRNKTDKDSEWLLKTARSYQSVQPLDYPDSLMKQKMVADLDYYLRMRGQKRTETTRCIVLREDASLRDTGFRGEGRKAQLDNIVFQKNRLKGNLPYINEVAGSQQIFIPMPPELPTISLPDLQAYLRPYGYTLTEEKRELTFLVISDQPR